MILRFAGAMSVLRNPETGQGCSVASLRDFLMESD